jgi:YVTN family beta-propeller protein
VSVINGRTNAVTTTIPVGAAPHGVAADVVNNTIYVANVLSNTVSVINGGTNAVTATIPVGGNPASVAVNELFDAIYVTNFADDSVSVINALTNHVTATIPIGTTVSTGSPSWCFVADRLDECPSGRFDSRVGVG